MKKSARVSEKLVSPGLPGLQVAMRLDWPFLYKRRLRRLDELDVSMLSATSIKMR